MLSGDYWILLASTMDARIINPQEGGGAGPYLVFCDTELADYLVTEGSADLFDPLDEKIVPATFTVVEVWTRKGVTSALKPPSASW